MKYVVETRFESSHAWARDNYEHWSHGSALEVLNEWLRQCHEHGWYPEARIVPIPEKSED